MAEVPDAFILDQPTGGYEDQLFIDPLPESFHCPVCLLVVREPHVLVCCGTHICQVCIERNRVDKKPCPSCNTKEYANIYNRKQHDLLLKLRLHCTNREKGCEWVGELGDQERHLTNKCLYVEETVTDDLMMLLENVTEKESAEMLPILQKSYEKYEVKQREILYEFNKDKEELKSLQDRLQQQLEEEIREMRKLDEKLTRDYGEIQAQLQAYDLHNSYKMLQLKQQLSRMKGPVVPTWYSTPIRKSTPSIPPFIINVTHFTDHKTLNADYYSAPFYSASNGYKMQLNVIANGHGKHKGTHVTAFVYLMKGINDERLTWPFTGDISVHLLNWREDKEHVKKIIPFSNNVSLQSRSKVIEGERAPGGFGQNIISHDELVYNSEKNTEYVNNDMLCFIVSNVSIPAGTDDVPSWYTPPETQYPYLLPPCTITMFNFREHKQVSDTWYSQPFYSGKDGYKLQLDVDANGWGDGKDTHISVGVRLMKGENDENLEWPVNSEITVQVLNWRENSGHVETIISHYDAALHNRTRVLDGETAPGARIETKFISQSELGYNSDKGTEYLQNDTLCFQVSKVYLHKADTGPEVPSWYITQGNESPHFLPPCTLSMFNFSEHKRVGDNWWSTPFYTGPHGYKLLLNVIANGDVGTHIDVYVYLMKGAHDAILTWPFKCDITIQLLNWREDKGHVEDVIEFNDSDDTQCRNRVMEGDIALSGCGYEKFISHNDLYYNTTNNTEYINNDVLCFAISNVIVHST